MPTYLTPGAYLEERSTGARPIRGVSTSTAAFVGVAERGPVGSAIFISSLPEFVKRFGGAIGIRPGVREHYLYYMVRHFFALGGTRCYAVRVAHYTDINDVATLAAQPGQVDFNAQLFDGTAVVNALRVSAISPGTWGTDIEIEVRSSSKFQLLLAEDIALGPTTGINLTPNDEVTPGSVLYLAHEIVGVIGSVVEDSGSANHRTVNFAGPLIEGGNPSTVSIGTGARVFKPDFSFQTVTDQAGAVDLSAGNPPAPTAIRLNEIQGLSPGDSLHFVVQEALVVVLSVETTTTAVGQPAMRAVIASAATPVPLPDLPQASTRVYARDFSLQVQLDEEVVETHENLSLAATNVADYVGNRLGPDSGASQYIVASEPNTANADDILVPNAPFTPLGGTPDDGLTDLSVADFVGSSLARNGLHALDPIEDASILVVAPSRLTSVTEPNAVVHHQNLVTQTIAWVENRRDLFYVIDPLPTMGNDPAQAVLNFRSPLSSTYAGIYFPWLSINDPHTGQRTNVPPSGAVAGVIARSDGRRGVHKAPAGFDVGILSVAAGVAHVVTRGENDILYPKNINAIRNTRDGIVVWGSRTIAANSQWEQVSIRRLFIFLERSIELGTQWVVFEPNDPTLWKTIEMTIKAFLRIQWLEGKLVGETEEKAFFVRCNAETNPPEIVNAGQVVTEIGVAPSRPAEFVIFRIKQFMANQG